MEGPFPWMRPMEVTHMRIQYQLFTLLGFDNFQNGLLLVWAILQRHTHADIAEVLLSVKEWAERWMREQKIEDCEFNPSCFLVDDSQEEQSAIREVFPDSSVDLCLWHVQKSWLKHLHQRICCPVVKSDMNKALGVVTYTQDSDPEKMSNQFMRRYVGEEREFIRYYFSYWYPKIRTWAVGYRKHFRSNQDTNAGIERWHATLKYILQGSIPTKPPRKLCWLLDMLTHDVEEFFWYTHFLKNEDRVQNQAIHNICLTAIKHAKLIPAEKVSFYILDGRKCAKVGST